MKWRCRIGWHKWKLSAGGSFRYCQYCTKGQVEDWLLTGGWVNLEEEE